MRLSTVFLIAILLLPLLSCWRNEATSHTIDLNGESLGIILKKEGDVNYLQCMLGDSVTSSWPLHYPVYRFLKGDVNNDRREDIAVGVIKRTRGDSVVRKRLFLFQVRNRAIIPLWLGSALSHPLEDFTLRTRDSVTIVRTVEQEKNGRYLVAEYEWFGFGLAFHEYLKRELPLEEAHVFLNE